MNGRMSIFSKVLFEEKNMIKFFYNVQLDYVSKQHRKRYLHNES